MGDRRARPLTRQFVDTNLVELTKQPIKGDEDAFGEWTDSPIAGGSQNEMLPVTSRTETLADPLTTSLLAEVARRTSTVEIDPRVVEAARAESKKPR